MRGRPQIIERFPGAAHALCRKGAEIAGHQVRTGAQITAIDADGLNIGDQRIDAANIFWAAGTAARPAAQRLGADAARNGAVKIGPDCGVPSYIDVFAVSDVSSQPDRAGKPLPGLAAVAKQQGDYVGRLLTARLAGKPLPKPFRYRDLGSFAVIGRTRAVAVLPVLRLTGTSAWLLWSLVHLLLLVDFRSRLAVYLNWSWSWFTYGRGARLVTDIPRLMRNDEQPKADNSPFEG